MNYRTIWE